MKRLFGRPTLNCDLVTVNDYCPDLLDGWAAGIPPFCYNDDYGVRLGRRGHRILVVTFHWKNSEQLVGETDSSGVRLHYTPRLRQYDAQKFVAGALQIELAPGQKKTTKSVCSGECTRHIFNDTTVHIAWISGHMHTNGKMCLTVCQ